MGIHLKEIHELRYGENPNQAAQFIKYPEVEKADPLALGNFELVQGDNPGFINMTDMDRSLVSIRRVAAGLHRNGGETPNIAIGVKHGNACGAAFGEDSIEVTENMLDGNPLSIFGGVLMLNYNIDEEVADHIFYSSQFFESGGRRFIDTVIAPSVDNDAMKPFTAPSGREVRLLTNPALASLSEETISRAPQVRPVTGGYLVQESSPDILDFASDDLTIHGEKLTPEQERWLILAWGIGSTSNSNTINLVKNNMLIANGVSQQDRVGAAELAVKIAGKAGHVTSGSVAYSDSFFPKADGPQVLIDADVAGILATEAGNEFETVRDNITGQEVAFYTRPDAVGRGFSNH